MIVGATIALGFGCYFSQFLNIPIIISAILLLGILSFVSFIGIKQSAWMNTIFASVTIAGLGIIIFLGFTVEVSDSVDYFDTPNGKQG